MLSPSCFHIIQIHFFFLFFFRPYVEYKGPVPQDQLQSKAKELEVEATSLITRGGKVCVCFVSVTMLRSYVLCISTFSYLFQVSVSVLSYEEASELCGGSLPCYIPKVSAAYLMVLPI